MSGITRAARLGTALVATTSVALGMLALGVPASAVTTDAGLFGKTDPTYDGVYRQSLAIIALDEVTNRVPVAAVSWLVRQQCADGSFQSYRADTTTACAAPDPTAFTGPDSNSTALAILALDTVGRASLVRRALTPLLRAQNADGGWGYTLGAASDVNSTGLVLAALDDQGATARTAAQRGRQYLATVMFGCTAPLAQRFALPWQKGGPANPSASAQGLLGLAGTLPVDRPDRFRSFQGVGCRASVGMQAGSWVSRVVNDRNARMPFDLGDGTQGTDWNATAWAVLGLSALEAGRPTISAATTQLQRNIKAYIAPSSGDSPAAIATSILVAEATGTRPASFGGVNLISRLNATLRK